jgi:hypothetical protein
MASRFKRSVPVTVNDVLDGHVALDLECLDRLYLHGYLGQLHRDVVWPPQTTPRGGGTHPRSAAGTPPSRS